MKQHSHLCQPETSAAIVRAQAGRTWRYVAEQLGYPLSFAPTLCAIAHCKPGQVTAEGEQELRRRLGLSYDRLHTVPVPSDHDAAVHLSPNGSGSLHTYTVPADAEVVIVPAGARIVQPKPASTKPRRKRWRLDLSAYAGQIDAAQVRELIEWRLEARDGQYMISIVPLDDPKMASLLVDTLSDFSDDDKRRVLKSLRRG